MTTWNTTYNFNQKSMNFGQAMLYGAFGQLTGMFGGGYGMGMGSYGMGMGGSLFSMMGMGGYGFGAGCCGMYNYSVPDSYIGAQCGLTAMNVIFQGIGGAIKSKQAAKDTAATNLDAAMKTLDITDISKFNPSVEFNSQSYNEDIASKIDSAIKKLGTIPDARPTENDITEETETKDDGSVVKTGKFKYKDTTYENKNAALKVLKEDQKKYDTYQELDKLNKNYENVTSVTSDLISDDIKNAIKAREEAKEEFNNAKEIVNKAYIEQKGQDATSSISSLSKDQRKNATLAPLFNACKAAQKHTNSQTLSTLKQEYDKFKDSITTENKSEYKQYSGTLESIVNWYNSVSENDKLEKIEF